MPDLPAYVVTPANVGHIADLAGEPGPNRFAIDCVRLAVSPTGTYTASATDGRRLGVLTGKCEDPPVPHAPNPFPASGDETPMPAGECLVSARQLLAVTRTARKKYASRLRLRLAPAGQLARIDVAGGGGRRDAWRIETQEGRLPDDDAVTPKGVPLATITVDPALLASLLTVCDALGNGIPNAVTLEVHPGPCVPLVVRCKASGRGQTFLGLLMPMTGATPDAKIEAPKAEAEPAALPVPF